LEDFILYKDDPDLIHAKNEFRAFLNGLSYDEVAIIQAIKYIGQDEIDPVDYARRKQE